MAAPPVSETRLKQIATDACDAAIGKAESYVHASTAEWNETIINSILKSLISETSTGPNNQPPFKYAINSTIIQHAPTFSRTADSDSTEDAAASLAKVGRRGMHSAAGAYWNNEKDGMWSYKYEGGDKKGLDVVINIMWIAIS
ncbi:Tctex-1 [Phyllosticta citricarpa]|uniref:Tctex-1 n=3 Tax=Phyllosticta TaxID=121621 RepID=A0ABR1MPY6_9PEZI